MVRSSDTPAYFKTFLSKSADKLCSLLHYSLFNNWKLNHRSSNINKTYRSALQSIILPFRTYNICYKRRFVKIQHCQPHVPIYRCAWKKIDIAILTEEISMKLYCCRRSEYSSCLWTHRKIILYPFPTISKPNIVIQKILHLKTFATFRDCIAVAARSRHAQQVVLRREAALRDADQYSHKTCYLFISITFSCHYYLLNLTVPLFTFSL